MTVQQTATDSACLVRPYGDTLNDGIVQFSFTLPLPHNELACEAARAIGENMGLDEVSVTCSRDLGQGFSFFVLYGKMTSAVDVSRLTVTKAEFETMKKEAIDRYIQEHFGRKLVFLGACIETDAHTVGIDAIMNMKGFNGHKGLESYHAVQAINLGAQVSSDDFVAKALEMKADALLVSQIVTQKNVHLANLTRLVDILEAEGVRDKLVLVVGGPRISHELAKELGYDAGFGPNTYAEDVASFVVQEMKRREMR
jgi:beta-lysine 5,6-aminomutase beta subunit